MTTKKTYIVVSDKPPKIKGKTPHIIRDVTHVVTRKNSNPSENSQSSKKDDELMQHINEINKAINIVINEGKNIKMTICPSSCMDCFKDNNATVKAV